MEKLRFLTKDYSFIYGPFHASHSYWNILPVSPRFTDNLLFPPFQRNSIRGNSTEAIFQLVDRERTPSNEKTIFYRLL